MALIRLMFGKVNNLIPVPVLLAEDGLYRGTVSESGGLVEVVPTIRAKNGPICGYRIVNSHKGKIPFEVRVGNLETISRH